MFEYSGAGLFILEVGHEGFRGANARASSLGLGNPCFKEGNSQALYPLATVGFFFPNCHTLSYLIRFFISCRIHQR